MLFPVVIGMSIVGFLMSSAGYFYSNLDVGICILIFYVSASIVALLAMLCSAAYRKKKSPLIAELRR